MTQDIIDQLTVKQAIVTSLGEVETSLYWIGGGLAALIIVCTFLVLRLLTAVYHKPR